MPKVMIDAGHYGKYNRSPAVPEYYESVMAWKLHLKLKAELEKYGIEVATTRPTQSIDLDVYNRGIRAHGYDMFLSLHSNAVGTNVRDDVDRPVVIRLVNDTKVGNRFAQNIADMIAEVMHTKQTGQVNTRVQSNGRYEYYGVLRGASNVGCPHAYIIEHSFHTATTPAKWLLVDSNLNIIARREAEIIAEFFGINKTEEEEPMTAEEKAYVKKLEQRIATLENANREYHYYSELPDYARPTIQALHMDGVFSGAGAGDMALPKDMMRILLINAKAGIYGEKYKNLK
jgi:N-acetylmuramoyl-L-alanine amidase